MDLQYQLSRIRAAMQPKNLVSADKLAVEMLSHASTEVVREFALEHDKRVFPSKRVEWDWIIHFLEERGVIIRRPRDVK